ncbi:MAG: response regulator transcription factor [Deferribacteres bacterium]|nr:response regulator transcription factor [candidate division KSB1 bacterium]MCB9508689.1 response regulator transcription factor [Deferribacteres bacterium]
MAKRILVVDDDEDILELLKYNLEREGYTVLLASSGQQALEMAVAEAPDLITLDVILPDIDGWDVLRKLRNQSRTRYIPVIFLTAKNMEVDEVVGLELGADDFISKPFSMARLRARIKNALRKSQQGSDEKDAVIRIGEILIDPPCHKVKVSNQSVSLTKKEFEIFLYLAKRPGRVVSRQNLLSRLWTSEESVYERTVDVYIRNIREKLGRDYSNVIQTIIGVGYRFRPRE